MPSAAQAPSSRRLHVRVLGELQVGPVAEPKLLPASRKTRALLAYLAVTARRHLRSELCSLFWEDAADPRAVLRWSLTQIRRALGDLDSEAICADRESVALHARSVVTDWDRVAKLLRPLAAEAASPEALIEASQLFRGEFLEGLDLPACYAYHEWCMAEREAASRAREQILTALIAHERDNPEQALVHARALVAHNPLDERGHIDLIAALGALGRRREALAQYAQCCRILERELGLQPPAALEQARAHLDAVPDLSVGADLGFQAPRGEAEPIPARAPLIGRDDDLAQLATSFEQTGTAIAPDIVLVTGVPGIGKSRLLDEFERHVASGSGRILRGRAFEAERIRPFGFWIDALRSLRASELPPAMLAKLLPLMHAGAAEVVGGDRDSLFDAVRQALLHLAQSRPVAVLVDDLQWIEASSAALLHYLMRQPGETKLLFVLTARAGELEDNASAQQLIAALAQAQRLRRIALGPLGAHQARRLIDSITQSVDADRIVAQAHGNPLILIEMARSQQAGDAQSGLLDRILQTRLSRVSQGAADLLGWASAFGAEFLLESLIAAQGAGFGSIDPQLAELERHDLIRAAGDDGYAFSHDLIRQAAYRRISQPRRRLMHKAIAQALWRDLDTHPEWFSELAHHAGLGGQHLLAARAAVGAGERGLRMFANREAAEVARRGLRHAAQIAERSERASLTMALLRVQVLATSGVQLARLRPDAEAIAKAIDDARACRLHAEVAQGHYLLSVVHQEAGRIDAAQQATMNAAQAAERSDALDRARQLANSARCLVELGRDIGRARALIREAESLAAAAGLHEIEVRWCRGLLHHWDGDLDQAVQEIDAAIALASDEEDRWRQCRCLATVAMIELERRRPQQALARARALSLVASQLGDAAEAPLAQAIDALARQMAGEATAPVAAAIAQLRSADDKSRLAGVLNLAAAIQLERKDFATANDLAGDALATADAIGEANESVIARATRIQAAIALGDARRVAQELEFLRRVREAPDEFSARAKRAANVANAAGRAMSMTEPVRAHAAGAAD